MVARELHTRYFFPQNVSSSFFRNIAKYLRDYIASHFMFENFESYSDYFLSCLRRSKLRSRIVLVHALKAHRGSGCIAPLILTRINVPRQLSVSVRFTFGKGVPYTYLCAPRTTAKM